MGVIPRWAWAIPMSYVEKESEKWVIYMEGCSIHRWHGQCLPLAGMNSPIYHCLSRRPPKYVVHGHAVWKLGLRGGQFELWAGLVPRTCVQKYIPLDMPRVARGSDYNLIYYYTIIKKSRLGHG